MPDLSPTGKARPRLRPYIFALALGFSVGLNVFFALRVYKPNLWHEIRLAMTRPPVPRSDDHCRGPAGAAVIIIEYSDFQCPFSAQIHPSLKKLAEENRIRWVYRSFPLSAIHPQATEAAQAAECAGEQGRFWEYADALFGSQDALRGSGSAGPFLAYLASRVGLDVERFQTCLSAHRYEGRIRSQVADGKSEQIEGTPTIFVNGKRLVGSLPFEQLDRLVRSAGK